jgi:hypothetical protein
LYRAASTPADLLQQHAWDDGNAAQRVPVRRKLSGGRKFVDALVDVVLTALCYLGLQERWVPGRAVSMHLCYKAVMSLNDQQEHVYTSART